MSETSPDAGRGTGVEAYSTNYPFVNPSEDVRGLLADFWLAHERRDRIPPFSISAIYEIGRGFGLPWESESVSASESGTEHFLDLIVVDVNGDEVCNTRDAIGYAGREFGDRFYVHEWLFDDMVCRAVQHRLLLNEDTDYPAVIEPGNGQLDERTYELLPSRLQSLQVGNDKLTGNIRFEAGWNISFDLPQQTLTVPDLLSSNLRGSRAFPVNLDSRIRISAIAGAGDGKVPGCPDTKEEGLRTINQIPPTAKGDFTLAGLSCIYVMPPHVAGDPTQTVPHALQIGNHCGTCKPCDRYVDIYQQLTELHNRLQDAGATAEAKRDLYRSILDDIDQVIEECVVPIKVAALGGNDNGVTVVTIGAQVTNTTAECYEDVELSIEVDFPLGGEDIPIIIRSASYKTFDDGRAVPWYAASWPNTVVNWERIRPGATVRVQYAVLVGAATGPLTVTGSGTVGGQPLPLGGAPYTATATVEIG